MKRDNFVLEAEKGIKIEVAEGKDGKVIIRAYNLVPLFDLSANYANPPISERYRHILGKWNEGFVIERVSDGSQFVWIPVGCLTPNGTIDGKNFSQRFGRRNYNNGQFFGTEYTETSSREFKEQTESVKKYGGFYFSRYNISISPEGTPQSVKDVLPWVNIKHSGAKRIAATFENSETVKSHLPFGEEYDSVFEWIIQMGAKTEKEVVDDSANWGNYFNTSGSPLELMKTGSRSEWSVNNIFDMAGNIEEWTQEQSGIYANVVRGGNYFTPGTYHSAVASRNGRQSNEYDNTIGFRIALYIK